MSHANRSTPWIHNRSGDFSSGLEDVRNVPQSHQWPVWRPIVAVIVVSILIRHFNLDILLSTWLGFDSATGTWPLQRTDPWYSFYLYGTYPPLVLGILGLVVYLFGRRLGLNNDQKRLSSVRNAGLFLALMLIIGPGLIVNGGLKLVWARPRPSQCQEFGGPTPFQPVGQWAPQSWSSPYASFPSGHAAIAFFLMGPAFCIHPSRVRLRQRWLNVGIGYGVLMSLNRIMQGGHFLSDVLWGGTLVYLTGAILARQMFRDERDYWNAST